jgi:hypothetical protein
MPRLPPGAAFFWNFFELNPNTFGLNGTSFPTANININVNTTYWGGSLTHSGSTAIMRSPNVQAALQTAVETYAPKY